MCDVGAGIFSVSETCKTMLSTLKISLVGTYIFDEKKDHTRYLTKDELSTLCKALTIPVQQTAVNSKTTLVVLGHTDRTSKASMRVPFQVLK